MAAPKAELTSESSGPAPILAPENQKIESTSIEARSSSPLSFEDLFSLRRLQKTCQVIRKEVRLLRARDVVDWLDWFLTLESSLEHLREQVVLGQYNPSSPTRFELGAIPKRGDFDSAIRSLSGTTCDTSVEDPRSAFNFAGKIHLPTTVSGESSVSENLARDALEN